MRRFGKRMIFAVHMLLCLALLCACGTLPGTRTEQFTVSYILGGQVWQTQQVAKGECPPAVSVEKEGLTFLGWEDSDGKAVDPTAVPVTGNVSYLASVQPRLTRHMPYLETDELGFLRPDAPLTGAELRFGLEALAEEAAIACFPELPTGESITVAQLKAVLYSFFDTDGVDSAVSGEDTQPVTRGAFAQSMHTLLGREDTETFILAANAQVPGDVTAQRTDTVALLEASVRHTADPEGIRWEDIELSTGWEPGFVNVDGWLYFVQEDGTLLRNGDIGDLHFGADGRYTSGDAQLDALVAEKLSQIMEANPDKTGLELLRAVYDHCHKDYKYLRKEAYALGATGWEVEDAKEMFTSGRGNCYNFAAIFWALASGLGYDVQCLAGTCTGSDQAHGWVELYYEGAHYFVDPEWQYAYTEREIFDKDMFMLTMDEVWWWTYKWDKTAF